MNDKDKKRCKVGELRPSQALTTFGIGAIIDLPHLSVMVMGLEDWPLKDTVEIGEQRLLASVKEVLGPQVKALRSAPVVPDTYQVNQFDSSALVGIPVAPFPRWMVCPYCRRLAPLGSGLFKLETPYRTDQIRYVHANCTKPGKPPTVVPARFVVAQVLKQKPASDGIEPTVPEPVRAGAGADGIMYGVSDLLFRVASRRRNQAGSAMGTLGQFFPCAVDLLKCAPLEDPNGG